MWEMLNINNKDTKENDVNDFICIPICTSLFQLGYVISKLTYFFSRQSSKLKKLLRWRIQENQKRYTHKKWLRYQWEQKRIAQKGI